MFLAYLPSPPSSGLSIGPLELRVYGLAIAVGIVVAIRIVGRILEQEKIGTLDDAVSIGMWGAAAGVVGARLYHVITDWYRFSDNLSAIPKIWEGGLGIPGGLLAGALVGVWQARRRGVPVGPTMSAAAVAIPVAQAIGRIGNWFNQELFGRPTTLPWGLKIDDAHLPAGYESGTLFHPTFLYEALWNLGLAALLWTIHRRYRPAPGRLMGMYVLGYGVGRFWVESLRIDSATMIGPMRVNQWVSLAAIAAGLIYLIATRGRRWPEVHDEIESEDQPDSDDLIEMSAHPDDQKMVENDDAFDPEEQNPVDKPDSSAPET